TSIDDAVAQSLIAYDCDCRALLMAPPFFFPKVDADGAFRWYAQVFERLGARLRDIILYHIPEMTRVGLSHELIARLQRAFPAAILGVKDSNGNWPDTERLLAEQRDLHILVGDERQLARAVRRGASGSICGLANLCPAVLRPLAIDGID